MDYGDMMGDAWGYAKDCTLHNPVRWIQLVIGVLLLGIPFHGYLVRVYRGTTPAPEVNRWARLCIDGCYVLLITVVYLLPLIVAMLVIFALVVFLALISPGGELGIAGGILGAAFNLLTFFVQVIALVVLPAATLRYARTGIFSEAFNIPELGATIGRIGWIAYLVAVVLLALLIGIPVMLLLFIAMFLAMAAFMMPASGIAVLAILGVLALLALLAIPLMGTFSARYLARVFDAAGDNPVTPAGQTGNAINGS
ncbi:MAG: DUF4013 domain-containing protein [Methanomicrobiales archaeon]|nr:DUF4013 domain-containing protein [Methanomicrobiales archaeon]